MSTDFRPIADYGLLADCNSAALVDRYGSIDWLCIPRYDSPACSRGYWIPRPATGPSGRPSRSPRSGATCPGRWWSKQRSAPTRRGAADRRDGLRRGPARPRRRHRLAARAAALGRGHQGEVEMLLELAPRARVRARPAADPRKSRGRPHVRRSEPLAISAGVAGGGSRVGDAEPLRGVRGRAASGSPCAARRSSSRRSARLLPRRSRGRIADTVEAWRSWEAEHEIYTGPNQELVRFSARVLKGLTYRPPARSSPPPPPRCPRPRAASATGTTASRGSATRA